MPDDCTTKRCIECDSHAVVRGKLDCNYLNRLGLSQPTVKTFMDIAMEKSPEKEMEELQKQIDESETAKKRLEELRGGGTKPEL